MAVLLSGEVEKEEFDPFMDLKTMLSWKDISAKNRKR